MDGTIASSRLLHVTIRRDGAACVVMRLPGRMVSRAGGSLRIAHPASDAGILHAMRRLQLAVLPLVLVLGLATGCTSVIPLSDTPDTLGRSTRRSPGNRR